MYIGCTNTNTILLVGKKVANNIKFYYLDGSNFLANKKKENANHPSEYNCEF